MKAKTVTIKAFRHDDIFRLLAKKKLGDEIVLKIVSVRLGKRASPGEYDWEDVSKIRVTVREQTPGAHREIAAAVAQIARMRKKK